MKILAQSEVFNPYKTSDITMIIALMSLEHRPRIITADNGIVEYTFENSDVESDVHRLLTNDTIVVSIKDVWAANQIWAMNLNRARS